MMEDEFFEKLREKILPYFEEGDGHGSDHVRRVYDMAIKISEGEDVDMDIVKVAALLHDVAKSKEEELNICHAEEGAKMAEEILKEMNFSKEKIEGVVHAIKVHRYSRGLKAKTREAEILQDADRLDALGATILVRMFQSATFHDVPIYDSEIPIKEEYDGSKSSIINHIQEKILKIVPESFKTSRAREIAKGRYDFIKEFTERYVKEFEGEL